MSEEERDGDDQPEPEDIEPPDDAPDGYSLLFKESTPDDIESSVGESDDDQSV